MIQILKSSRLVRIFLFFVATTGFLIGMKTKTIGKGSIIIDQIDVNVIAASVTILLIALFLWALAEILQFILPPPEIKESPSFKDFIETKRKISYDSSHFEKAYDTYLEEWDSLNKGDPLSIYSVVFLIISSVFLGLLSQILIISSVLAYLL